MTVKMKKPGGTPGNSKQHTQSKDSNQNRDHQRIDIVDRLASKTGLRPKIDAYCCSCIYDPFSEGTWRLQVQNCTACDCPLYEVRPTSSYAEQ